VSDQTKSHPGGAENGGPDVGTVKISRSAETRGRVLEAALDLFIERGYDKVSLREIAERVGVTKAALYYYFPSKEQLLLTLVEPLEEMRRLAMETLDRQPSRAEWAARLAEFIAWMLPQRRLFELMQSNQPALREIFGDKHDEAEHQQMHERVNQMLSSDSLSLDDKVRMVGAAMMAMGVLAMPLGNQLGSPSGDELQRALVAAVDDLLL
jgi:AcrR family transcriptional regulator